MTARLRQGMGQPYAIRITDFAGPDFDPTTPTGATFNFTKPSGAKIARAGVVSAQTVTSARASYDLASADLDELGTWRVWVQWTVPGQTPGPRTEVVTFAVIASDGV